jgi:alkylation response protein AidB-like acyl-CoA dehydrogenase
MSDFFQEAPRLASTWSLDPLLRSFLARRLPPDVSAAVAPELERLGERAAGELADLADAAEREPPRLVSFDPWGRRIDHLELADAWRRLHAVAAEEGLVAEAYERRFGESSRLVQMAKVYLFHPSSAFVSCPLAMTDGAARILELHGSEELKSRVLPRLTSRDPARFWTSGQWMTEREGGSDVAGSSTVARPRRDGGFLLSGVKWFASAASAEVALALARIDGAPAGNRGLTLFLVELEGQIGRTVRILRLKDKLGTRALPTAELELAGVPAIQIGEAGRGVATIATLLTLTRLHNSACAAASLARGLELARDYAARRSAFGHPLAELPLHAETLAALAAEQAAALALVVECAALVGRDELGSADADERARLRLLVPLTKLLTGRQAVAGAAETLEAIGGAAYMEDTGLPRLARDAQVLAIWEGTTNVLALDALRAIARADALPPLLADVDRRLAGVARPELAAGRSRLARRRRALARWFARAAAGPRPALEAGARAFALALARLVAAVLLAEQADWELGRGAAPTLDAALRASAEEPFGDDPGRADELSPQRISSTV